jgi:glucosamine--fructose-6-phosphate aminotransferase (isomerizing)
MCGIVGHIGDGNSVQLVLEGLKRLEYRGYDSSGVCFRNEFGQLTLYKKTGKLHNLKSLLRGVNLESRSCVGHTRWATHGVVNDENSHPHLNDFISIVHNGIIENASELKKGLLAEGVVFKSETDSEVFLGCVYYCIRQGMTLFEAVSQSFQKVEGNSAFVIQKKDSEEILAIKRGAPLVCGLNSETNEVMVSSDPYALIGMVDQIFFPEDDVICVLSRGEKGPLSFYEIDGQCSQRYMSKSQDASLEASEKGHFEHYMLKEIHEQPGLIRSLADFYFKGKGLIITDRLKKEAPSRIQLNACGTAFYAGLVVRNFIEKINGIPVITELASEFRYKDPIFLENDIGLFISQSGETADTLAAQSLCADKKIKTYALVNVEGSTLSRQCDENIYIKAGMEIGVASTKAFTQQVLSGRIMAEALKKISDYDELSIKFTLLAHRLEILLSQSDHIKKVAEEIYKYKGFFFTGRGVYFPIALEGALKLKEIAYVHAEGYAAGELKHGPIALIDEQMVNIAIIGPELLEKTVSNVEEIKARRGVIVILGPEGRQDLESLSDYYIPLNFDGLEELSPVYVNVANQLLSYYMAKFKGTDIDKPRNLAKSVIVE